ncbi:MAG: L-lactate permease [Bacillota bacterium]|jgi:lactate permease
MQTVLSFLPILVLLFCLLVLKLPAGKAGAASMLLALVIAVSAFGLDAFGLTVAMGKGMSLALYVLLIIWAAVFLYHLVAEFKATEVINRNIVLLIRDPFVQFLTLAWLFSAVLQGIAGFGVPVIIVVPILVELGFNPVASTAAVLIGHSWAVTFGSMGSSFFTMYLVTGIPQRYLGITMGIFDVVAMLCTGLAVCYLYGGWEYVRKGLKYVLPTVAIMSVVLFTTVKLEMVSLVGLMSALSGLLFMYFLYQKTSRAGLPKQLFANALNLGQAVLPYGAIIGLSLLFQILKLGSISLAFRFPGFTTALGYAVKAENAYSRIKLFGHPAPVILISALAAFLVYKKVGIWSAERFRSVLDKTVTKCVSTSISLMFLIIMALIMMDSGMTNQFAVSIAGLAGSYYPLLAPFFGVLGSFITGSNTNSNVIFGRFQYSVAQSIGVSETVMCGAQSIGGSVGVSMGPTTVLMGASAAKLVGEESLVYRKVLIPTLLTALALGIVNYLLLIQFGYSVGAM